MIADMLHLLSVVIILEKIRRTRGCAGISLKSQELYLLVFITRYLDLFTTFISVYLSVMKLLFIASAAYIVYLMRYRYYASYDKEHDTFRVEFLLVPCAILALIINDYFEPLEVSWIMGGMRREEGSK
jgi:ER lumen protein retaining receptor